MNVLVLNQTRFLLSGPGSVCFISRHLKSQEKEAVGLVVQIMLAMETGLDFGLTPGINLFFHGAINGLTNGIKSIYVMLLGELVLLVSETCQKGIQNWAFANHRMDRTCVAEDASSVQD